MTTESERVALLEPRDGAKRVVLDTDAANEIDDQFVIAWAALRDGLDVEAVYAAPFVNHKAGTPRRGMELSLAEARTVLELAGRPDVPTFAGVTGWLPALGHARRDLCPAAADLVERAATASPDEPLYVVALGAPTNVAQALLAAPEIGDRIVVVWLGCHPSTWHRGDCFNSEQDVAASNVLLDGVAPLVHLPAANVTEHLRTSRHELAARLTPSAPLGEFLLRIYDEYQRRDGCSSKEIWDLGPVAWLVDHRWVRTTLTVAPRLTESGAWARHPERPLMREAWSLDRDAIFEDLFAVIGER